MKEGKYILEGILQRADTMNRNPHRNFKKELKEFEKWENELLLKEKIDRRKNIINDLQND